MNRTTLELARHFLEDAPADAAYKIESMAAEESAAFLDHIPAKIALRIMLCLSPASAASILINMQPGSASDVLAQLNPNQLAGILRTLKIEFQDSILKLVNEKAANACQKLLSFPPNCIGSLVITDVPVFSASLTIEDSLQRIKSQNFACTDTIFVNDTENHYLGALKPAELIVLPANTRLEKIALSNTERLSGLTPVDTAAELEVWLRYDTLAIVDTNNSFVGSFSHFLLRRNETRQETNSEDSLLLSELGGAFKTSMLGLFNEVFS